MDSSTLALLKERGDLIRRGRTIKYILFSKTDFSEDLKRKAELENIIIVKAHDIVKK
jgi:hypothetical protein